MLNIVQLCKFKIQMEEADSVKKPNTMKRKGVTKLTLSIFDN